MQFASYNSLLVKLEEESQFYGYFPDVICSKNVSDRYAYVNVK